MLSQRTKSSFGSPAYRLILSTALKNWFLLALNLMTNLVSALLEGSTLAIVYFAISFLSGETNDYQSHGLIERFQTLIPISSSQLFFLLLGAAVLSQMLLSLASYYNKLSAAYLSACTQPQVTSRVFKQIMSLSFACASRYKIGDLVMFANGSAGTVHNQIQIFNNLIVSITFAGVYFSILVTLSPFLALAAVILASTIVVVQRVLLPRLVVASRKLKVAQVEVAKYITENIQALRLLHTFGTQQRSIKRVTELLQDVQHQLQWRARVIYLPDSVLGVLPIFALSLLAALAYILSDTEDNILPMLLTFLLALQRLAGRLRGVSGALTQLADNTGNIERLNNILTSSDKQFSIVGGERFECLHSDIVFEEVSLAYATDQTLALQNLSLTIPKNQVTALVGQSGAGKSSIIDLLVGLYQPSLGHILINNNKLQQYDPVTWRQCIGVVSQDTFIFNDTILENLRYGAPNATIKTVIEATQAAQAHQFISDLPDGYNTVIGERGYRLSGGQRQRLALARAIIKQPQILILDEATSALDTESERLIQQALADFQQDRTVIVVAHRLSTIVDADQIIVLEKGKLIEQGCHESLMQLGGRYAHYWNLQTQGVAV